jgi:hypothetical protein
MMFIAMMSARAPPPEKFFEGPYEYILAATAIVLPVGPTELDRHILAVDIAGFLQALTERRHEGRVPAKRSAVEEPDHWQLLLLRLRNDRPCRRAAECGDDFAPSKANAHLRYDTIAGSAFDVAWGEGYDLVLVPNFLHHFNAASCTDILGRARAALTAGGRVAIVEWVPNEDRVSPPVPALFSMTMLLTTPAGATYTASELAGMLADSGFAPPEVIPLLPTPLTLLLSRRQ